MKVAPDRQKIIGLIAECNRIRVEKDDPVFAAATICQAYLEEAGRQIEASLRERLAEFESAVGKMAGSSSAVGDIPFHRSSQIHSALRM